MKISVISPVYGAEKIIPELVKRISNALLEITKDYEIILIEDHSPDNSWEEIRNQCAKNSFVKGIKLSRNFGQHNAIKTGIDLVSGDCCIVMDCDLQDDPLYIKELVKEWQAGNDIVYTFKEKRNHSGFKNITARLFNMVFNYLANSSSLEKAHNNVGSYSLISSKVISAFKKYNDYQFHYLMVLRWLGFQSTYIKITHNERFEGESSYSFIKLVNHAMVGIIYQSDRLLKMSIQFGFILSFLSIMSIIFIISNYFISGFQSGWASLFVLITFFAGVILTAIGILGLYIGKMFDQVKNRPQYVIDETLNI